MSVLSFRKSVEKLDAVEQRTLLRGALVRCIETTGQYAVELKSEDLQALRCKLEGLQQRAEQWMDSAEAERLQADFRGELRAYRDLGQAEVRRLRAEMADIIESMQAFLASSLSSGKNHERALRGEFSGLEVAAESGDLAEIRRAIQRAAEAAIRSIQEIQRSQEVVVAQLQDEIRHLHAEVSNERRAAMTDPMTGLWNRVKLDSRIRDLVLLNDAFCVFFVGLPSLTKLSRADPRVGPAVMRGLAGRLQSVAEKNGEVGVAGRWSEEVFAIIFNLPLSGAPTTPAALEKTMGGSCAIQLDGASFDIHVDVLTRAVERQKDAPEGAFYLQLGQAGFGVVTS